MLRDARESSKCTAADEAGLIDLDTTLNAALSLAFPTRSNEPRIPDIRVFTSFFFPVINGVGINAPGVCGSPPESVSQVRKDAADQIAAATNLSVTLDGVAIKIPPRVQSKLS